MSLRLNVRGLVLPSGPSIHLPLFCSTWPVSPLGVSHLEAKKLWFIYDMVTKISPGQRDIR